MTDAPRFNIKPCVDFKWLMIAVMFCAGDPDIIDGIVHFLMNAWN